MYLPNMLCLLTGALLASSAIAGHPHKQPKLSKVDKVDPDAIAHAIDAISESTKTLGETVSERPMNIIKSAVIQTRCWGVAKKIKKGIKAAEHSKQLNMTSGFKVLLATDNLVKSVNKTMKAVIEARPAFAELALVPLVPLVPHMDAIVLKNLKRQSQLSAKLGERVLLKVPEAGKEDGKDRLEKIAQSFAMAIAVYQNKGAVAEDAAIGTDAVEAKTAVPFVA